MRLLISAGGTGGHVYPALAVVEQLRTNALTDALAPANSDKRVGDREKRELLPPRSSLPSPQLLWLGSRTGVESSLVCNAGIPFRSIESGALRGRNPVTAIRSLARNLKGILQSLQILEEFDPQVCLATGGYVCAPVSIACQMRGVPLLIYLPDMTPGLAVRWLSRLAQRVAVSFPEVAGFFGRKAVDTGYPVRAEVMSAVRDRDAAREILARKLEIERPDAPLLLVFGGSQGARSINRAIWKAAPALLPFCQILHVIGTRDWPLLKLEGPDLSANGLVSRYHPVAYLHEEMPWALAGADLVVARAGASVLAEFPLARLPSVLVPLPIAGSHQMPNAQKLAQSGGAIIVEDRELAEGLEPTVAGLLADERRRLAMGAAVGALARPQAADNIVRELHWLAARGG
ncbi:MAG: UDP-N-acetylglucosamine--N-acetylmuramyl-(pentapeptide) pyrophosphoryl-undecaprenol N-acetylglucosamine transferase [Caldilineaceae bacterium]|nr:UDP-N-acetylglucosamine--N-acetylmuramyl-(pentapeptide) pyrophosphoryl-undecaprenol N-acetylglucosamine transferase [Caldilineaceae bacterium]